jgi:hypothetical protein
MDAQQTVQREQQEKMALIKKYAPEFENSMLDQGDITLAVGKVALEKITLEKQLNAIVDKLINVSKERDALLISVEQYKAQMAIIQKPEPEKE